jgi:hypothetical protein
MVIVQVAREIQSRNEDNHFTDMDGDLVDENDANTIFRLVLEAVHDVVL